LTKRRKNVVITNHEHIFFYSESYCMFMLNTLYVSLNVLIYTHFSTEMTLKCILVYH